MIPFHRPYIAKNQINYIQDVIKSGETSNGGKYGQKVEKYFSEKLKMHSYFTNSCTASLELASLLSNIKKGDEVILPTYTYPSTANAFALRGAKLVFIDSSIDHPNLDLDLLSTMISNKTKVVIPLYYAGVSIDWDKLYELKNHFEFEIVEEAAHSIGSNYQKDGIKKPLGSLGDYSVFSFHETKNVSCGEGGLFCVRAEEKLKKLEFMFEKGTNKKMFDRGELDYYEWCSIGSSFGASEFQAAILLAQLEEFSSQNELRMNRWNVLMSYFSEMDLKNVGIPNIPDFAEHNAHVFYLVFSDEKTRKNYETFMKKFNIPVFSHYRCLHQSSFGKQFHQSGTFKNAEFFQNGLTRISLNPEISLELILEKTEEFIQAI